MAPKAMVIGFGNALRGDDALGLIVAGRLARRTDAGHVEVLAKPILTPELAADLAGCDVAIFVDAATGGEPGEVECQPISADFTHSAAMTHHLTPSHLLAVAKLLYGSSPRAAYLVSCQGVSFDFASSTLSEPLCAVVDRIVEQVCRVVESTLSSG